MKTLTALTSPRRQRGVSTLLIAILLLAIVTVITVFAVRYGVYEQRTAANEYRYKIAFQVAEAGLNQSMEFVKTRTNVMLSSAPGGWFDTAAPQWAPCSNALPAGMAVDPCLAEPDAGRRANMFRYVGTGNGILPVAAVVPTFGATAGTNEVGGFPAAYASYATLCRLDRTVPTNPQCTLAPDPGDAFYVTLVSRGTLADENAAATVKQSYGTFRLLGNSPAAPLIAAAATGLGNAQIIPNPNGGGFGIPVSVWSKGNADVSSGASFATCQLGEWLDNPGNPAPSAQDLRNGVCLSCSCNGLCPGYGLISGNANSCGAGTIEGEDILDVDSNFSDAVPKLRDSKYYPDDLFLYTFNIPKDQATDYLSANATEIKNCGSLTAASSGLYWYTGGGDCAIDTVGTVEAPVVLVSDKPVKLNANGVFFGIIYVRDVSGTNELLKASGTPHVYGAVLLEGNAKMSGTPTIVYNEAVLNNVRNSPDFLRYGPVPGSWSDTVQ